MTASHLERPATDHERNALIEMLAAMPGAVTRWKRACGNAFILLCTLSVLFVLVWCALSWLWRRLFTVDYGLHSEAAPAIVGIALPLLALCAIVSTIRWVSSWKNPSPALREDLEAGLVVEEQHVFRAAKRIELPAEFRLPTVNG